MPTSDDPRDPEELTEREVEEEAATSQRDPITEREGLETELMDEGESERGGAIGEHID